MEQLERVRVDRWLWAVRLTKTRSGAAQACQAGHVQVNRVRAKPAATVKVGDMVRARVGDRERVVESCGCSRPGSAPSRQRRA